MADLRTRLFLSYSKSQKDVTWRDAFVEQLKTLFGADELWIDSDSIGPGDAWQSEIKRAIEQSRCALVLVTPKYLEKDRWSRKELAQFLAQGPNLIILPVLIDVCPWDQIEGLRETQFLSWGNSAEQIVDGRATLTPLSSLVLHERTSAIVRMCENVRRRLGVVGQTGHQQLDDLFSATKARLKEIDFDENAVHSGTFSVVYRGTLHGATVAVKAVPDAPRQNRIRAVITDTLPKVRRLTDAAFIQLRDSSVEGEPHYFVMDYVEWPTLEQRLVDATSHRFEPRTVAIILAQIARAHSDAHRVGLLIGPLALGNIHVSDEWRVRLSPLRIEGMLARALYMPSGQMMNWEALTYLAPEVSAGQPVSTFDVDALDRLDQYYLGLLGLELLTGRPPCEVRCFDDLALKAQFFQNPRSFFQSGAENWTDTSPALAYMLVRLLARNPGDRLGSSNDVAEEFDLLERGLYPECLSQQLEADLEPVAAPAFAEAFYERLLTHRPTLAARFSDRNRQSHMLAEALPDLVAFRPERPRMARRFVDLSGRHAKLGIDVDDINAFRSSFLAQIDKTFAGAAGHKEAWQAALDRGLAAFTSGLSPR